MSNEIQVMNQAFFVSNESIPFTFDGRVLQWRDNVISVKDIISVEYFRNDRTYKTSAFNISSMLSFYRGVQEENKRRDTLVVNYVQYLKKNILRKNCVKMQGDYAKLRAWGKSLKAALVKVSKGRPKKCLVFINPFSGHQNSVEIFQKKVKPLLKTAAIETRVVITKGKSNFAKVIATGVEQYDSILAVGGDGTVSEIVNALILHYIKLQSKGPSSNPAKVPEIRIPVAILPCGSTDCIAYTINGTRDLETSALIWILGNRCKFDVCKVVSENGLERFFLSVFTYGYLSDLVRESEKFRWMGPIRYNYAGLLTLARSRVYHGRIELTGTEQMSDDSSDTEPQRTGEKKSKSKSTCSVPMHPSTENAPEASIGNPESGDQVLTLSGRYFLIACANISCASEVTPNGIAPLCGIGNGSMNVVLFQPNTICDLYRIYSRLTSKDKGLFLSDLPYVTIYKTKQVKMSVKHKDSNKKNSANCDGELFHDSVVNISIYKGIVQFFSRKS